MQLLKWLRQEGALPRDLAYPLEDAEELRADFSRLQRVLRAPHVGRCDLGAPGSPISVATVAQGG